MRRFLQLLEDLLIPARAREQLRRAAAAGSRPALLAIRLHERLAAGAAAAPAPPRRPEPARAAPSAMTTARLVAQIRLRRPDPGAASGPLVSAVVLTRNGREHLERLLDGLENATRYRSFELVVVDNGSSDGSGELLARGWSFPVKVVRNEHNVSFSQGCNQGVEAASGELVLLLNNDVAPINPGWLGSMVAALDSTDDVAAVGALLVYPEGSRGAAATSFPGLTVQHRGMAFGWREGVPGPVNLGAGDDPTAPDLVGVEEVPAATAACLLLRRRALDRVGGLSEDYVYGWEDADLSLRLRDAGYRVVVCRDAALFHHEFGTQRESEWGERRRRFESNRAVFAGRWSPKLGRTVHLDRVSGEGFWAPGGGRRAVITVTRDDPAAGYGDWYTGHEQGLALEQQGWVVGYAERHRDHWYEVDGEVALWVSLLPQFDANAVPGGAVKVAWVRNWPDRWVENPSFDRYDLALCASAAFARIVERRSTVATALAPLATNPDRFRPGIEDPDLAADYAFTGNYWAAERPLLEMVPTGKGDDFRVYGSGWEAVPAAARWWRGALAYDRLPSLYASTPIILDDTPIPNRPALNARVFDALAAGSLVLTDNPSGSEEVFAGALPSYRSAEELGVLLDRYRRDEPARRAVVEVLRHEVLARHTYRHRAAHLLREIDQQVRRPKVGLRIGAPNRAVSEQWGDTHFARRFAAALRRFGYRTECLVLSEWDDPARQDADVMLHLRGLTPSHPRPGHVNVLWIISHPDEVTAEECERFELVLVASERFAAELRRRVAVRVEVLLQAADIEHLRPVEPAPDLASRLLFVGNSRRQRRPAVLWAVERGLPLTIYGSDWEPFVGRGKVAGTYFPNDRLPELYGAAEIVLNDHWPDMAEHGFVSNRILDALASGAFVISDPVAGLEEMVGDAVPVFEDASQLEALVHHYLQHPEERMARAAVGMEIVRSRHGFERRAERFHQLVAPLLEERGLTIGEP